MPSPSKKHDSFTKNRPNPLKMTKRDHQQTQCDKVQKSQSHPKMRHIHEKNPMLLKETRKKQTYNKEDIERHIETVFMKE